MSMSTVSIAAGVVAVLCASRVAADMPAGAMGAPAGPPPEPSTNDLAALDPPYVATADVEYTPLRAPPSGPAVMDVGMGMTVATATACAEACIASTEECNMATWLGNDPTWTNPENCYLKIIEQPCEVPAEAEVFENAYLLMAQTGGCEMVSGIPPNMPEGTMPGMVPGMAPAPAGMAPMPSMAGTREVSMLPDGSQVPAGTPGSMPTEVPISAAPPGGVGAATSGGAAGPGEANPGGALGLVGGAVIAAVSLAALLA